MLKLKPTIKFEWLTDVPNEELLLVGCDSRYFKSHGPAFVSSANHNKNNVHIHIVNPDKRDLEIFDKLKSQIDISLSGTFEKNELIGIDKKTYYACSRFRALKYILGKRKLKCISLDIDSLIMSKIEMPSKGLGLYLRQNQSDIRLKLLAGALFINGNEQLGIDYITCVTNKLKQRKLKWYIDQIVMYECLPSINDIHIFESNFLDWHFTNNSIVWTAKGPRKNSAKYLEKKKEFLSLLSL